AMLSAVKNGWAATAAWAEALRADRLRAWWTAEMGPQTRLRPGTVAVIMAGNLPWVGLHDVLSVLLSGCKLLLKPSAKDRPLWTFWAQRLWSYPETVTLVSDLNGLAFAAVIATGSDNSFRYFDYSFRDKPALLRHHRTSCAVLSGNEDDTRLAGLWEDMLRYYGLGCRNVSKLFVPRRFDWARFLAVGRRGGWLQLLDNAAYAHNYGRRKALLEMQGVPYRDGGAVLFEEGAASPGIGSVSYAVYDGRSQAEAWIAAAGPEAWQCIVGEGDGLVPFGQAQRPTLADYADGVSIPAFLKENFAI
ncbi:MAG: aldehyde dehydrogenase, partial [Bacteroidales bacterium]|nr:aldehyde dehydrogenase [Bacteroidales bacterium]